MSTDPSSHFPPEVLEQRAAEQRKRLHNSVSELRSSLTELRSTVEENVRERLNVTRFARQHLGQLVAGVSLLAMLTGYGVAGMFTRH
jgi:ABC-type transporter MlaC component